MHERANHASGKIKDWQFVREVHRKMVRVWFPHFSALERLALIFVYDRTLGWGKEWERITMEHCAEGVYDERGQCFAAPFTSCRKRAGEVMRGLCDAGAIRFTVHPTDKAKRYALNFDFDPSMKLPKRLKEGGGNAPLRGAEPPHCIGAETPHVREGEVREVKQKRLADGNVRRSMGNNPESREELEIAIVKVRSRAKARSAEKKRRGRALRKDGTGFHPNKAAILIYWRDLWLSHYPDLPIDPVPKVLLHILWQYWKAWTESRKAGEFEDYLEWVFENWNAVRLGSLGWMADAPKAPAARMLVSSKLRGYFEEAYREKEAVALWRKLEPHERRLQELVEKGMDPDKARESVEKEFATKKELVELRQARERMSIMLETFNRRESRTDAVAKERKPLPATKNFKKWEDE
jgi:hypothetical protein